MVASGVFARARNPVFTTMITAQAGTVLMTTCCCHWPVWPCSSPRAICGTAEFESPICERPTATPT
jgi:hypothetical protein